MRQVTMVHLPTAAMAERHTEGVEEAMAVELAAMGEDQLAVGGEDTVVLVVLVVPAEVVVMGDGLPMELGVVVVGVITHTVVDDCKLTVRCK